MPSDFERRRQEQLQQERAAQAAEEGRALLDDAELGPQHYTRPGIPRELATAYHEDTQQWMHPFSNIRRDGVGFFIEHEDNPDGWRMRVGDLLQDVAVSKQPYWQVEHNRDDRVSLQPIGSNPFLTGVGAGGMPIRKADLKILSGEYEDDRITAIQDKLAAGDVRNIDDVAYILLGTCGVRFGPNGPEGGWYSATDTASNRGGREQMTANDIVQADADALRRMGLAVSDAAIQGEIDPHNWTQFVGGPASFFRDDYKFRTGRSEMVLWETPEEDFGDLNNAMLMLHHTQNDVQMRSALRCLNSVNEEDEYAQACYDALFRYIENGRGWWLVNEQIINWAKNDPELLIAATKLPDGTNRKYAYWGLTNLHHPYVERAILTEDDPEALTAIASAMAPSSSYRLGIRTKYRESSSVWYMPGRGVTTTLSHRLLSMLAVEDTFYQRFYLIEALKAMYILSIRQGLSDVRDAVLVVLEEYERSVKSNPDDAAWIKLSRRHMQRVVNALR
jgi:hypothetical protein